MAAWGAILSAAGSGSNSILSGFFAANDKRNEARIAKYNAAVARMKAKAIRMETKFKQVRQAEEGARIISSKRAAIGGSGTVATEGAPLLAIALQKSESDLQNYLIGYEGRVEAEQFENQALQFDMQKEFARIAARQSLIGGWLGAGASGVSSWSNIPQRETPNLAGDIGGGSTAKYNAWRAAKAGG